MRRWETAVAAVLTFGLLAGCGRATAGVSAAAPSTATPAPSPSTFRIPASQATVWADGFPDSLHKPHQDRETPAGTKAKAEVLRELDAAMRAARVFTGGGEARASSIPCMVMVLSTTAGKDAAADRSRLGAALTARGWTPWVPKPADAVKGDRKLHFTKGDRLLSADVDTTSVPQTALVQIEVTNLC